MLVDVSGGSAGSPQRLTLDSSSTRLGWFDGFSSDDQYALYREQTALDSPSALYLARLGAPGDVVPVRLNLPEEHVNTGFWFE